MRLPLDAASAALAQVDEIAADDSAAVSASAEASSALPVVPTRPKNLCSTPVEGGGLQLNWIPADNAVRNEVFAWEGSGFQRVASLAAGEGHFRQPVAGGAYYLYAVRAVFADGASAEDYLSGMVPPRLDQPAPINLTATAVGHDRIDLDWSLAAGVERVEIFAWTAGGFAQIAAPSGAITHYSHTSLPDSTFQRYAVRAIYADQSRNESYASSITLADPAHAAPTHLQVVADGTSALRISWEGTSQASGIDVLVWANDRFEPVASLPAGTTSYRHSGLLSERYYNYAVRARYGNQGMSEAYQSGVTAKSVPASFSGTLVGI